MDIIIAGDGEVGMHLAQALEHGDHNITIVDPHEELLKMIESQSDLMTIIGDSTSIKVLQQANVKKADLVIAALHDEHINLLTGILAKKLGAKKVIVRVNTMENLSKENWRIYQDLGIDGIVSPEDIAAQEIINLLKQNVATEAHDFAGGKLELLMIKLEPNAPSINKTLEEVIENYKHIDFRALAIHRRQNTFIPKPDDVFLEGDLVYVITKPHAIKELMQLSGKTKFNVNNVMIVGGGRVGKLTAKRLEDELNIKIFEMNKERSFELTNALNNTLVINADARDVDLLEDEGIKEGDVVERTGKVISVPVGENLIGRVVNSLGQPVDGKGQIEAAEQRPIERNAPGIIQRKSVSVPLQTGIKAIDSMIQIGRAHV